MEKKRRGIFINHSKPKIESTKIKAKNKEKNYQKSLKMRNKKHIKYERKQFLNKKNYET